MISRIGHRNWMSLNPSIFDFCAFYVSTSISSSGFFASIGSCFYFSFHSSFLCCHGTCPLFLNASASRTFNSFLPDPDLGLCLCFCIRLFISDDLRMYAPLAHPFILTSVCTPPSSLSSRQFSFSDPPAAEAPTCASCVAISCAGVKKLA